MQDSEKIGSVSFAEAITGYRYEYIVDDWHTPTDDELSDYERLSRWRERWTPRRDMFHGPFIGTEEE